MRACTRCWAVGFLLGVLPLAGCRQFGPSGGAALSVSDARPASRGQLSSAQVADIEIALASTLEENGTGNQAASAYIQALKKDPNRPDACLRLAILLDRQGKFEEAADWYAKAVRLAPKDPAVYVSRGYSLYLQEQWNAAEDDLRKAIKLEPDHKRAHNNLGLALARSGREKEALAEFRLAGCNEAQARANLGYSLTVEGRCDEAAQQFQFALACDPQCAAARKGMANVKGLQGRLAAAQRSGNKQAEESELTLTSARVQVSPVELGVPQSPQLPTCQPVPK